jgi:hypothetical protein
MESIPTFEQKFTLCDQSLYITKSDTRITIDLYSSKSPDIYQYTLEGDIKSATSKTFENLEEFYHNFLTALLKKDPKLEIIILSDDTLAFCSNDNSSCTFKVLFQLLFKK